MARSALVPTPSVHREAANIDPMAGQMGHVCHRGNLCLHMHYPNGSYHWLDLSACR